MMDGSSSCTEKTLIDDSYYHNLVKLYEPLLREYLIPKQIVFELRPFIGNGMFPLWIIIFSFNFCLLISYNYVSTYISKVHKHMKIPD